MTGKFSLFLLMSFGVLLSQSRIINPQPNTKALDEVIKVIEELLNKLQKIISDITSNIPEFLKDLQKQIEEIIKGLNLDEIVAKIKDEIEKLLGQAGEHVQTCVDAQEGAILQLAEDEKAGALACVESAEAKTQAVQEQIKALLDRANQIRQDVVDRISKCFKENGPNISGLVDCLKAQVDPIKGELKSIEKEVEKLIQTAQEAAQIASTELAICMQDLSEELEVKEQAILEDIKKCILGN